MTCPICDQKPMNCDCTATERQQYSELSDMEDTVASLQAEIERLRSQPCPYVTGDVTRYCTLTPLTLTDAEREAVEWAVDSMSGVEDISASWSQRETAAIATLRGLLERTK